MKNLPLFIYCFLCLAISQAQSTDQVIIRQFDIRFPNKEVRGDLVQLRDFLETKDAEYAKLKSDLQSLNDYRFSFLDSASFVLFKKNLESFLLKHPGQDDPFEKKDVNKYLQNICIKAYARDSIISNGVKIEVFNIKEALYAVDSWIAVMSQKSKILKSLENVNNDRDDAAKAIQKIYTIEAHNQLYKTQISLYYAIIIFVLLLISFLFLYLKSSDGIGHEFLNGNGLQFIALFAIIISTILFGILGILEGKELAAILSGIAGFILGKGLSPKPTPTTPNNNGTTG